MTPPRVRRTAEEARRVILDAAEKRLREGGPEALRLQEIARDVGVSHPAILHHFQSRAGLTHALAERAMTRLEEDLREALSGSEGDGASILERVFATLGDLGHARLLAWRALSEGAPSEEASDERMLAGLTDLVQARRRELGSEAVREDSEFLVRLVAGAMLGDAIFGGVLNVSLGHAVDDAEPQRGFRSWLARLLETHFER